MRKTGSGGARDAQQDLPRQTVLQALDQAGNRRALVAGWLEAGRQGEPVLVSRADDLWAWH